MFTVVHLVHSSQPVRRARTRGHRRHGVKAAAGGASALSKDRHSVRVTTEEGNVLLDPLQRQDLIVETAVARIRLVLRAHETWSIG